MPALPAHDYLRSQQTNCLRSQPTRSQPNYPCCATPSFCFLVSDASRLFVAAPFSDHQSLPSLHRHLHLLVASALLGDPLHLGAPSQRRANIDRSRFPGNVE